MKSISYLKSQAAQTSEGLKNSQEKESFIAALKIIAIGDQDRLRGNGISVAESRAQLAAARQRRQ